MVSFQSSAVDLAVTFTGDAVSPTVSAFLPSNAGLFLSSFNFRLSTIVSIVPPSVLVMPDPSATISSSNINHDFFAVNVFP
ncbi:hypothetical protein D3C85_1552450 [compost metagenome]